MYPCFIHEKIFDVKFADIWRSILSLPHRQKYIKHIICNQKKIIVKYVDYSVLMSLHGGFSVVLECQKDISMYDVFWKKNSNI